MRCATYIIDLIFSPSFWLTIPDFTLTLVLSAVSCLQNMATLAFSFSMVFAVGPVQNPSIVEYSPDLHACSIWDFIIFYMHILLYDSMMLLEALQVLDDCSWLATKWPNTDLWQLLPVPKKKRHKLNVFSCILLNRIAFQEIDHWWLLFTSDCLVLHLRPNPWGQWWERALVLVFGSAVQRIRALHFCAGRRCQGVCIYLLVGLTGALAYGNDIRRAPGDARAARAARVYLQITFWNIDQGGYGWFWNAMDGCGCLWMVIDVIGFDFRPRPMCKFIFQQNHMVTYCDTL